MALSPSIPTSFVPKQPAPINGRRFAKHGNNILLIVAVVVLAVVVISAGGEFLYQTYLSNAILVKANQIVEAQKTVSQESVNQFIRLRDRLNAAKTIANQHIVPTQFLNLLETITVQNVHFDALDMKVNDDRSAAITMTGTALNFNALEAQSVAFANQQDIQNSVFSGFVLNKDNTVSFSVSATLTPEIIIEKTPVSEQTVPVFGPVPAVKPIHTTASTTATSSTVTVTSVDSTDTASTTTSS